MARMPEAEWLGEHSPKTPMSRFDIVCVHTIVGYAPAHAAHFSTHQGGTIQQSRDTKYRSAANLDGNHRIIAIENEDHGSDFPNWNTNDGHAVPALTDAQVTACAKILAWAHETHGIPLQLCPDSKPGGRGLAYHRQGIDGNWSGYDYPGRVSGGEVWTSSPGKVCPGDRRISQLPDILARAKQIVNGDDTVSYNDVWRTDDKMKAPKSRRTDDNPHWWPENVLEHVANSVDDLPRNGWRWRGIDYVNDNPATKDHQLARAHEYSHESVRIDRRLEQKVDTLLELQGGADGQALREQIDARADAIEAQIATEAQRREQRDEQAQAERAAIIDMVDAVESGDLSAIEFVDAIARRLSGEPDTDD